jgi:hypothetical protein
MDIGALAMSYRIKPQDLTPLNSSPFMTMHGGRVQIPLKDALASEDLFMTVRSNLRAGDTVRLCRYGPGDWTKARVLEFAEVIITQSTPKAVLFRLLGEIVDVEPADPALDVVKKEPELPALEVADDPQGGVLVREVVSGNVHKHFKSKVAADRYIADYGGKKAA